MKNFLNNALFNGKVPLKRQDYASTYLYMSLIDKPGSTCTLYHYFFTPVSDFRTKRKLFPYLSLSRLRLIYMYLGFLLTNYPLIWNSIKWIQVSELSYKFYCCPVHRRAFIYLKHLSRISTRHISNVIYFRSPPHFIPFCPF